MGVLGFHPVDAERPPVLTRLIPADQIPAGAVADDPIRFDVAAAFGAVGLLVIEAQSFVPVAGGGDVGEAGRRGSSSTTRRAAPNRPTGRRDGGAAATALPDAVW